MEYGLWKITLIDSHASKRKVGAVLLPAKLCMHPVRELQGVTYTTAKHSRRQDRKSGRWCHPPNTYVTFNSVKQHKSGL